jgi:magnesium transporter
MLTTYPVDMRLPATQGAKPIWLDLFEPTDEERTQVEQATGFKLPSRDQLSEVESSSRVYAVDDVLYLSMPLLAHIEQGEDFPTPLGFVLSAQTLVTIRYTHLHPFDTVANNLRKEGTCNRSTEVFTRVIEAMVDAAADILEHLAADLGGISKSVFRRVPGRGRSLRSNLRLRNTLANVGEAGEKLSQIRETLLGLQRIVIFTSERATEWTPPDIQRRVKTARNDLTSLSDYEIQLFEKAQFLLDAVLGFINTEQNDIFRVLTIVSVVGIPPTLIASMYGMNFKNMPELSWEWGYQWGLGLIALSIIIPVIWFKRRGWW